MAMRKFDCVEYEKVGQIAIIRLNNPERRNSINLEMRKGLNKAFGAFEDDENMKVAILTGVGNSFCSGQDAKEMANLTDEEKKKKALEVKKLVRTGAFERLAKIPKPIIAAVNGYAVGLGWFIATECDLVVAAESALFWQNEPLFGFQGGGEAIATQGMSFHIGMELTLAFKFSAKRCYEIGLVNRVVPDDQLMPAAMEMAEHICTLAPVPVKIVVEACRNARLSSVVPSSIVLANWLEHNYLERTVDVQEAFKAFVEKRKPTWKGKIEPNTVGGDFLV